MGISATKEIMENPHVGQANESKIPDERDIKYNTDFFIPFFSKNRD